MIDIQRVLLFLVPALVLAITPGPGIFYVAARTLAGGRSEGLASSFGTGVGGLVHVAAGAVGISALLMASAEAFAILKLAGALYLIWLGFKTWREAGRLEPIGAEKTGISRAFRQGLLVEALNPKTAAFFLAFIPQFVDPSAGVARQFIMLGVISVVLNTAADVVVSCWAAKARAGLARRPLIIVRMRQASAAVMCALGGLTALRAPHRLNGKGSPEQQPSDPSCQLAARRLAGRPQG